MNRSHPRLLGLVFTGTLAGLALSACNKTPTAQAPAAAPSPLAALPLTDSAAPPIAPAPPISALLPGPPVRVAQLRDPSQGYAYLDRAYAMGGALGDAPPDYAYDYNGVRPWVWQGDDGSTRVVEPTSDGDRYYYYDAGTDYPYLVRDRDHTYGYDNGELVMVYDQYGRELPQSTVDQQADFAGRYLARARALYDASRRQQREAVARANWESRRQEYYDEQNQWVQDQNQDADWRAYHDQHAQEERSHWSDEHYRRESEAAQFAQAINDTAMAARDLQAAHDEQAWAQQARAHPGGDRNGPPPPPLQMPPAAQTQVNRAGRPMSPNAPPQQPQAGAFASQQAAAQPHQRAMAQANAQANAQAQAQARQRAAALGQSQQTQQQAAINAAASQHAAQNAALARAQAQRQAQQRAAQSQAQATQRGAAVQAQRAAQQQAMQAQAAQRAAAMQGQRAAQQQAAQAQAGQRATAMQAQRAAQAQAQAQAGQRAAAMQAQRAAQQQAQAKRAAPPAPPRKKPADDKPAQP